MACGPGREGRHDAENRRPTRRRAAGIRRVPPTPAAHAGPLRALFIFDQDAPVYAILSELRRAGYPTEHRRVCTESELQSALTCAQCDIAFLPAAPQRIDPTAALTILHARDPDLPAIVIGDAALAGHAIPLVRAGAADFVTMDNLALPPGAVARELRTYRTIAERRRLQQAFLEARKLEVFASLAAGINHDFNNILMAIPGFESIRFWPISAGERAQAPLEFVTVGVRVGLSCVQGVELIEAGLALPLRRTDCTRRLESGVRTANTRVGRWVPGSGLARSCTARTAAAFGRAGRAGRGRLPGGAWRSRG